MFSMVYFEVKRRLLYINAAAVKLKVFETLFFHTGIDSINKKTLDIAITIYIQLRKIGVIIDDADMLIAAYCIQNGYILVSNNAKHFANIDTLQIENWFEGVAGRSVNHPPATPPGFVWRGRIPPPP
jgi:predicted nucleic acid-binding protein